MTTITKDRLLTIQHWRETYGPGSNVVLPAEEAEELARIALASLAAVSDERAAYELFMEKRFGESVDRRRAKNGDREYMAWDMALGWIIWCHRAAMLQAGNFRENKGSSTNNFREISETSTNYPVTPDGWISCSERMPDTKTAVLVARDFGRKGDWRMKWATYIPGHPDANDGWIIPGASWKPSHWMPLPEPPQEVRQ
ncbi:valyl-tRNA synthetase [Escherichia coli O103:H25 str. 2010C-4529]|uniref:DUF551 domain-containing protein n=2 Tax=Escherichia coli TaxID=562 RepID=UPI000447DE8F|nr:DUF551 domain-containing protein [Escherichia coli]EYZ10683.1 valyl-tRNA synthetase [Escherichia coli O103:H25 str. 2010C-4529]